MLQASRMQVCSLAFQGTCLRAQLLAHFIRMPMGLEGGVMR